MGGDAVANKGASGKVKVGDEPFSIPDAQDAADRAKAFCISRGLTSNDVKIVRADGKVKVVVKRDGAKIKVRS